MKKIKVIKPFRDKETGEYRGLDLEVEYRDERAEELVAGGWAIMVEEPKVEEKPEPAKEIKKAAKGKKKK